MTGAPRTGPRLQSAGLTGVGDPFAGLQHHRERFGIGQTVIVSGLDQGFRRQAAVADEGFGIGEGDHVVEPGVEDPGAGRNRCRRAPVPPCGAQQHQRRVVDREIHRDSAAARRAYDHVGPVPVEFGLRGGHRALKVLVVEPRVDDFVAVACEVGGL